MRRCLSQLGRLPDHLARTRVASYLHAVSIDGGVFPESAPPGPDPRQVNLFEDV